MYAYECRCLQMPQELVSSVIASLLMWIRRIELGSSGGAVYDVLEG